MEYHTVLSYGSSQTRLSDLLFQALLRLSHLVKASLTNVHPQFNKTPYQVHGFTRNQLEATSSMAPTAQKNGSVTSGRVIAYVTWRPVWTHRHNFLEVPCASRGDVLAEVRRE